MPWPVEAAKTSMPEGVLRVSWSPARVKVTLPFTPVSTLIITPSCVLTAGSAQAMRVLIKGAKGDFTYGFGVGAAEAVATPVAANCAVGTKLEGGGVGADRGHPGRLVD